MMNIEMTRLVLSSQELVPPQDGTMFHMVMVPEGNPVANQNDEPFVMDEQAGRECISLFNSIGNKLVVDFNHQSEFKPDAEAAGWIERLSYEKGKGLIAEIDFGDMAEKIRKRKWRYISPVVQIMNSTRRVFKLKSAGLTHSPALVNCPLIYNSELTGTGQNPAGPPTGPSSGAGANEGKDPMLEKLRAMLGMPTASEEEVLAKVRSLKDGGSGDQAVANAIRKELGVKEDADKDTVLAMMSTKVGANKTLEERLAKAESELTTIANAAKKAKAKGVIDAAIAANKINPNDQDSVTRWTTVAERDPDEAQTLLNSVTPFAKPGGTNDTKRSSGANASRETIIANSVNEYRGSNSPRVATMKSVVNQALVDAGFKPLTRDEETKHVA